MVETKPSKQRDKRLEQPAVQRTIPSCVWALQYCGGLPGKLKVACFEHPSPWHHAARITTCGADSLNGYACTKEFLLLCIMYRH